MKEPEEFTMEFDYSANNKRPKLKVQMQGLWQGKRGEREKREREERLKRAPSEGSILFL